MLRNFQINYNYMKGNAVSLDIPWPESKIHELCVQEMIDYAKAFGYANHKKNGKFLKRWEYQTTWCVSWEICMQVKKPQLELDMKKKKKEEELDMEQ